MKYLALLAAPFVAATTGAAAAAPATDGLFEAKHLATSPYSDGVPATQAGAPRWLIVGDAFGKPTEVTLLATQNDNKAYQLLVRYPSTKPCDYSVVRAGGALLVSNGSGSSGAGSCDGFFTVPASAADAVAHLFHVAREDRHPAGEAVTATFSLNRPTGRPVELSLVLDNPGKAPGVWTLPPYPDTSAWPDPTYTVRVVRDGKPVPRPDAMRGGNVLLPIAVELAAGGKQQRVVPLARYADVSTPGHYEVQCTANIGFAARTTKIEAIDAASWWDRSFTGSFTFDVR